MRVLPLWDAARAAGAQAAPGGMTVQTQSRAGCGHRRRPNPEEACRVDDPIADLIQRVNAGEPGAQDALFAAAQP
jgi:hypothetical protein